MVPATISRDELREIGLYIGAHIDAILARWKEISLAEHPEACASQRQQLFDSLPEFLQSFGQNFAHGDQEISRRYAIEHGLQRWSIGWNIEALSRDFLILRRVLVRALEEDLQISPAIAMAVAATLDEAVAVSVGSYVEHRELELARHNEALRAKNYELKRFAHLVAHEIRNPLAVISLAANAVERHLEDPRRIREEIEQIEGGRDSMVAVIEGLLKYASLDLDESLINESVDLNEVLQECREHLQFMIESSQASIVDHKLPTVPGARVHLLSVFENIVENAIKYAGQAPPRIEILGEDGGDMWHIRFTDHGLGITEDDQALIFRFLARGRGHENVPGSGIGLSLCRRIAEMHGGAISVESQLGQGSTFTLSLPKKAPQPQNPDGLVKSMKGA